jgi:hypothetical protein
MSRVASSHDWLVLGPRHNESLNVWDADHQVMGVDQSPLMLGASHDESLLDLPAEATLASPTGPW